MLPTSLLLLALVFAAVAGWALLAGQQRLGYVRAARRARVLHALACAAVVLVPLAVLIALPSFPASMTAAAAFLALLFGLPFSGRWLRWLMADGSADPRRVFLLELTELRDVARQTPGPRSAGKKRALETRLAGLARWRTPQTAEMVDRTRRRYAATLNVAPAPDGIPRLTSTTDLEVQFRFREAAGATDPATWEAYEPLLHGGVAALSSDSLGARWRALNDWLDGVPIPVGQAELRSLLWEEYRETVLGTPDNRLWGDRSTWRAARIHELAGATWPDRVTFDEAAGKRRWRLWQARRAWNRLCEQETVPAEAKQALLADLPEPVDPAEDAWVSLFRERVEGTRDLGPADDERSRDLANTIWPDGLAFAGAHPGPWAGGEYPLSPSSQADKTSQPTRRLRFRRAPRAR